MHSGWLVGWAVKQIGLVSMGELEVGGRHSFGKPQIDVTMSFIVQTPPFYSFRGSYMQSFWRLLYVPKDFTAVA